jgi:rubredoxin
MARVVAHEDVKHKRFERKVHDGSVFRTDFMRPPNGDQLGEPVAFIAESTPNRVQETHYHIVEQYQVIISGGGTIGRHPLKRLQVHYSRPFTPYAIVADSQGCSFLTLRPDFDTGAQQFPDAKKKLKLVPNRKPWQMTEMPKFEDKGDVYVHAFSKIKDENGLASYSIKLKPGARTKAADPKTGGGQFIAITRGSLIYQGKDHKAITIIWVGRDEEPFELVAGAEGLEALVMGFPRTLHPYQGRIDPAASVTARNPQHRIWECEMCGFIYDEAEGLPADGIAPGTRWEDIPDTWSCPECVTEKSDFRMRVIG